MSAGSPAPLLEVRELEHRYDGRAALRGVSFAVAPGEVFGLLGPNGSGKSTALALICGRLAGGERAMWLAGERRDRTPWRRWAGQLGVVFQSPSLDLRMSARENLALIAALQGLPRHERGERISEALAAAGLEARADEPTEQLSGGMRRRLDLARALLHRPRLLLLDEPTAGLDERAFRDFWTLIRGLRRARELSVLVATHRPEEAEQCQRLGVLLDGALIAEGTPAALRAQVSEDRLELRASDGDGEALARVVHETLGLACVVDGAEVVAGCEGGAALIPRLVERLPEGALASVSLRRPTLADVFLEVTGQRLEGAAPPRA